MLSIIIPSYLEEGYIAKTAGQFKGKLHIPHEVIVADGGSPDRTIEIAKQYADHVVVYPKDKKQNISKNRNNGAAHAKGEFFVFLDSACTIPDPQTFFERALKHFEDNPKLIGLTASIQVLPEVATWADRLVHANMTFNFIVLNNIFGRGAAVGKFQMIRREAFERVQGYREDLPASEEMDLFHRLSKFGQTRIDPKLIVYHPARRAHKVGYLKLVFIWNLDALSLMFRNKVVSKEWTPIR